MFSNKISMECDLNMSTYSREIFVITGLRFAHCAKVSHGKPSPFFDVWITLSLVTFVAFCLFKWKKIYNKWKKPNICCQLNSLSTTLHQATPTSNFKWLAFLKSFQRSFKNRSLPILELEARWFRPLTHYATLLWISEGAYWITIRSCICNG